MIITIGILTLLISTAGIWGFSQTQGRGLLSEILGPEKTVILISSYFVTLSRLGSVGFIAWLVMKELPSVRRTLPSLLLSVLVMPMIVVTLSAMTIPIFAKTELTLLELAGEMIMVVSIALGFGLADYLLDRKRFMYRKNVEYRYSS